MNVKSGKGQDEPQEIKSLGAGAQEEHSPPDLRSQEKMKTLCGQQRAFTDKIKFTPREVEQFP